MDAYKEGMSAELAKYAGTLCKSHRMVSSSLGKRINDAICLAFAIEVERKERMGGGGKEEEEVEEQQQQQQQQEMEEEGEGVTNREAGRNNTKSVGYNEGTKVRGWGGRGNG